MSFFLKGFGFDFERNFVFSEEGFRFRMLKIDLKFFDELFFLSFSLFFDQVLGRN